MNVILGIDAAWTENNPSGVALVKKSGSTYECLRVAPSYASFIGLARGQKVNWNSRFSGSSPNIKELLNAAEKLAGNKVDIVTIDMPVSTKEITGGRDADKAVSSAFGAYGAGVFMPKADWPGKLGKTLTNDFEAEGYTLAVPGTEPGALGKLIEVYPHPALMMLLDEDYRLLYKKGDLEVRLQNLNRINQALCHKFGSTSLILPEFPTTKAALKPYEDAIDALVCAWVGTCYLEGCIQSYPDKGTTDAIWVPNISLKPAQASKGKPYDHHDKAGNQGDVVKHVALIAAADTLMQGKISFQYADTFSGYAYNPIRTDGEWQEGIGKLPNQKIEDQSISFWKSLWHCPYGLPGSTYPGSSTFIRKLCMKRGIQPHLSLWDTSQTVISQLKQAYGNFEAKIFERSATLADIVSAKPDLLFIDPPDLSLIEKLLTFVEQSESVIIWLPTLFTGDVETPDSRKAYDLCSRKGLQIISVSWQGESNMRGCRLVCKLPLHAMDAVLSSVKTTTSIYGWGFDQELHSK